MSGRRRDVAGKRRKRGGGGGGVPEWVVTFGDMMSLLLCFFILLQMFSELKRPQQFRRVVQHFKEAFGYIGGVGTVPVDDPPLRSLIETLETVAVQTKRERTTVSANVEPGVDGPNIRVTRVRDGIVFAVGGPSVFEPFSAEVRAETRAEIERLIPLMKGRNNKIEIVGHAAAKYLPPDSPWSSLDALAFARAESVRDILLAAGIDDRVLRISSAGMREPVRPRASDPADAAQNRRVEVILTEILVDEVDADTLFPGGPGARAAVP